MDISLEKPSIIAFLDCYYELQSMFLIDIENYFDALTKLSKETRTDQLFRINLSHTTYQTMNLIINLSQQHIITAIFIRPIVKSLMRAVPRLMIYDVDLDL
jgi:hypothetical protein